MYFQFFFQLRIVQKHFVEERLDIANRFVIDNKFVRSDQYPSKNVAKPSLGQCCIPYPCLDLEASSFLFLEPSSFECSGYRF